MAINVMQELADLRLQIGVLQTGLGVVAGWVEGQGGPPSGGVTVVEPSPPPIPPSGGAVVDHGTEVASVDAEAA